MKLVVGVTGASGSIYGVRLMEVLHDAYPKVETHLVVSKAGIRVLRYETEVDLARLYSWASVVHPEGDIGARPASGSAGFDAMVIAPCSLKTLGLIATGTGDNLICRAADVMLKEQKKLVLLPREMPLSAIHLENMHKLALMGVFILPASPGFYFKPQTMEDLIDHVVGKTLTCLGLEQNLFERWRGQHPERRNLVACPARGDERMNEKEEVAAQLVRIGRHVFGLKDENRIAGDADEVVEMLQTLSAASIEKTQEPFAPPAQAEK